MNKARFPILKTGGGTGHISFSLCGFFAYIRGDQIGPLNIIQAGREPLTRRYDYIVEDD
jgi:hypothetical protein